jgi:hypothetical protein
MYVFNGYILCISEKKITIELELNNLMKEKQLGCERLYYGPLIEMTLYHTSKLKVNYSFRRYRVYLCHDFHAP